MIHSWTFRQRRLNGLLWLAIGLFIFGILVKISWLYRPINLYTNQAAFDTFYYHVPQINEFITHGLSEKYHNFVSMTPGLHIAYAYIARSLNLGEFDYQSPTLFAIHSVWMVLYLALNVGIVHSVCLRNEASMIIAIPLLASSYAVFSWIWPTTDLPAADLYLTAVFLEFQTWPSDRARMLIYAALGVVGILIRQQYVFLAGVPAGIIVIEAILSRRLPELRRLAFYLLPLIPSILILGFLIHIWGGLVPPDQAYHFAPLSAPIALAHILGFTGLIGAPFALSLWRLLRQTEINPSAAIITAVIIAVFAVAILPLNASVSDGRYGSMLWTIEDHLHSNSVRLLYLFSAISLGTAIWFAVITICVRLQYAPPTLVIFGLYWLTLLVEERCFQRYIEEPILLTLSVFILLLARLPKFERIVWIIWFGLYGVVWWGKLLVNVGGLGQRWPA
jgi:hypothetical protein